MAGFWVERVVPLKYLLGEFLLFSVRFPLLVLDLHFTDLLSDPAQSEMPFKDWPPSVQGILIRSQPVTGELPRLSLFPHSIRYVPARYQRFYTVLQGSFADYLKHFSPKSRSTLTRKVRKFTEFSGGRLEWREFCRSEEMEEFHSWARKVSALTYQERLLKAGLPADEHFRQELVKQAGQGRVRGYILFHAGKPVAYLLCSAKYNGILLYRYLGYDPEFQKWSPGTVLQYLAFEKLFTEGAFRMFDFTEGEGAQKEFFSTASTPCADVYSFRRTPKTLFLVCLHSGLDRLSAWIVRILDRLGLKARIKKFFRFRF